MSIKTRVETIKCNKSKCDCYGVCIGNIDCRDSDRKRWCAENPNGKEVTIVTFEDGREEIIG